jgi:hypothetical protein
MKIFKQSSVSDELVSEMEKFEAQASFEEDTLIERKQLRAISYLSDAAGYLDAAGRHKEAAIITSLIEKVATTDEEASRRKEISKKIQERQDAEAKAKAKSYTEFMQAAKEEKLKAEKESLKSEQIAVNPKERIEKLVQLLPGQMTSKEEPGIVEGPMAPVEDPYYQSLSFEQRKDLRDSEVRKLKILQRQVALSEMRGVGLAAGQTPPVVHQKLMERLKAQTELVESGKYESVGKTPDDPKHYIGYDPATRQKGTIYPPSAIERPVIPETAETEGRYQSIKESPEEIELSNSEAIILLRKHFRMALPLPGATNRLIEKKVKDNRGNEIVIGKEVVYGAYIDGKFIKDDLAKRKEAKTEWSLAINYLLSVVKGRPNENIWGKPEEKMMFTEPVAPVREKRTGDASKEISEKSKEIIEKTLYSADPALTTGAMPAWIKQVSSADNLEYVLTEHLKYVNETLKKRGLSMGTWFEPSDIEGGLAGTITEEQEIDPEESEIINKIDEMIEQRMSEEQIIAELHKLTRDVHKRRAAGQFAEKPLLGPYNPIKFDKYKQIYDEIKEIPQRELIEHAKEQQKNRERLERIKDMAVFRKTEPTMSTKSPEPMTVAEPPGEFEYRPRNVPPIEHGVIRRRKT